ncbi:TolC family protein [Salibacter sp.]|uniref:TolC family protein n=1 Tax=Salibacter sp. TaxID=2010995 RepID=UPI0028705962|nr:TolC family protein [Salibacter sp.]MDR9488305.1 TolC family protein [Salibacter sp.]
MNKVAIILMLLCVFGSSLVNAQDEEGQVLTFDQYMMWVKNEHPLAKNARLLVDQAEGNLKSARGGFDPQLYGGVNQKRFAGSEYYHISEYGLKVPTWFGIEGKVAYEYNRGTYLNPENNVPENGLLVAGVKVPVGKRLFIDQRRAQLRKAQAMTNLSQAERILELNSLLQDAASAYWKWSQANALLNIDQNALDLAQERFEGIVQSYLGGDLPAIDTTESFLTVQQQRINVIDARQLVVEAKMELETFLWKDEVPLELEADMRPQDLTDVVKTKETVNDSAQSWLNNIYSLHPKLRMNRAKIQQAQIDRRLKLEKLKPQLDLSYNYLSGYDNYENAELQRAYLNNNYKFGIDFKMPLFLRDGRGEVAAANAKLDMANFEMSSEMLNVKNKLNAAINKLINLNEQLNIQTEAVKNYEKLLRAEEIKFDNGESSVFLINSRQMKLVSAQEKLTDLQRKHKIAQTKVMELSGVLFRQF